jgi:hypothetical protein
VKKSKADGNVGHVYDECKRTVAEWNSREAPYGYGWPDDWARWQRALDDVYPWPNAAPGLDQLA